MSTITIHGPEYVQEYIRPHPNGMYGLYRLSYGGRGVPLVRGTGIQPNVTTAAVAATLAQLQAELPLGILGDYEVLCTGWQLCAYDDPAAGYAWAVRVPGWIALSGRVDRDLYDLLAHEIAHELQDKFTPAQLDEFWRIVGQQPGDRYGLWEATPQERFAEYLSAAIWRTPVDDRMPQLDAGTLARIREWALRILGPSGPALIVIGGQAAPAADPDWTHIRLRPGANTAIVDGGEVPLVPGNPEARVELIGGHLMVPLAFVTLQLGGRKEWHPDTSEGEFWIPRPRR